MFVLEDGDDKNFRYEDAKRPGDNPDSCRKASFLVTKPVTGEFSDRILQECLTAHAYDMPDIPQPEVSKS